MAGLFLTHWFTILIRQLAEKEKFTNDQSAEGG